MLRSIYIYIPIFPPKKTKYKYKNKIKYILRSIYVYIPIFLPIKTAYKHEHKKIYVL
jgi:hypothetical protein